MPRIIVDAVAAGTTVNGAHECYADRNVVHQIGTQSKWSVHSNKPAIKIVISNLWHIVHVYIKLCASKIDPPKASF